MTTAELARLRKRDSEWDALQEELAIRKALGNRLAKLERENAVLKALCRNHGISFE